MVDFGVLKCYVVSCRVEGGAEHFREPLNSSMHFSTNFLES